MKKHLLIHYVTFLYISLPVLIFFFGWLHLAYAVLLSGGLLYGCFAYLRRIADETPASAPGPGIDWRYGLLIAGLAFLWVLFSGIGGFANQDWDHHFRNALFRDLINEKWPVFYNFPASYPDPELAGKHSALNYYLTFWLPAALVGKVGGTAVANVFLLLWSYTGILLTLYYLNRLFRFRHVLLVSVLFMGWSGLDVLGRLIMHPLDWFSFFQLEAYYHFAYAAFTSDLYNVFNQAIPTWLLTLWVFNYAKRLNLLPIAFLFAYAPFPFIGLALLYNLYYVSATFWATRRVDACVRTVLAELGKVENIVGIVCLLLPYALFYGAHTSSVPSSLFWSRYLEGTRRMKLRVILFYFVTFFLEVGVYLGCILWLSRKTYQSNKLLFWLCAVLLLFIPFWAVGTGNDFASRGSMPFLVILCILTTKALIDRLEERRHLYRLILPAVVLLVAWITPAVSITDGIALRNPPVLQDVIGSYSKPNVTRATNMHGVYPSLANYYSHQPRQHFFYKYLAK